MSKNVREFFEKMQEFFPSTKNAYIESVEEYGEVLETVVIEDIFMPELLTLLAKNEDAELLSNIFNYFEEIIKKNDPQPELCACDNSCHTTVLKQCNDKSCRSYCENGTYHNKQYNTEYTHDILHHISKVDTTYL